ncbi:MAG TPA: nitronate monooxygenase [Polyangiaceae bacterium]|nr:nitronate monooxygenase [Polyangiaceae bacterium]
MRLDRLFERGAAFLGAKYPIVCGAMSWLSDHRLVAAMAETGAFGLLAAGNLPVDKLREEIEQTRALTRRPFGVNLITIAPNYLDHLALVTELGVPTIVFAGSIPKGGEVARAKDSGAKVICFAATDLLAHKMIDQGADALILEGSEAGGHIGPVSLTVLLQQILFKVDSVPIFVAGGIARGQMMAHLLLMGAAGVQMGTLFVMSEECSAHPAFKETFRRAKARDAMATPSFDSRLPVIPVRALQNEGTIEFKKLQLEMMEKLDQELITRAEAQDQVERFWLGALRRAALEGDVKTGSLMAGQSVGLVDEVKPLAQIVRELVDDAERELERVATALG